MPRLRKSPRLADFDYVGPLACHLTFVTRRRQPFFSDPHLASICIEAMQVTVQRFCATVAAYCVMPDHVHILVAIEEGTSLTDFAKHFKQLSGFRLKRVTRQPVWQISYHDHVLRREESLLDVARYIWENPVNEGLVPLRTEYPFSGPRELLEQA